MKCLSFSHSENYTYEDLLFVQTTQIATYAIKS